MAVNQNVNPRPLTAEEKEKRARGIYDSFATYVVFCEHCRYVRKTNMYIMRAEAFLDELDARGEVCPRCGKRAWTLGYPMGTTRPHERPKQKNAGLRSIPRAGNPACQRTS